MDPLESIWNKVARPSKDGKKYIVFATLQDLMYLYASGFVDAQKYSFKQWSEAFSSSREPDGSYCVSAEQWAEKKKFHYRGPIDTPFDPLSLEERLYTEREITRILTDQFIPSTIYSKSYVPSILNHLRTQGKMVGGEFQIDLEFKKRLSSIIDQQPSPLRVLQVIVHRLRSQKKGSSKLTQKDLQKSGFEAGATAQQVASARLSDLMGIKGTNQETTSQENLSLKELQRRRKTPRKV